MSYPDCLTDELKVNFEPELSSLPSPASHAMLSRRKMGICDTTWKTNTQGNAMQKLIAVPRCRTTSPATEVLWDSGTLLWAACGVRSPPPIHAVKLEICEDVEPTRVSICLTVAAFSAQAQTRQLRQTYHFRAYVLPEVVRLPSKALLSCSTEQ